MPQKKNIKQDSQAAQPAGGVVAAPVTRVKNLKEFREASQRLQSEGYTAVPGVLGGSHGSDAYTWDDYISSRLECPAGDGGKDAAVGHLPLLHVSSGTSMPVATRDKKKGSFITWGAGNRLPNVVSLLLSLSPYTAAALKFNIDLATGMGPRPMYQYTQYVGGNITEKKIRLEDAGTLLRGMKRDLQMQLFNLEKQTDEQQESQPQFSPGFIGGDEEGKSSVSEQLKTDLRKSIAELDQKISEWESTNKEVQEFLRANNLTQTYQQLYADMIKHNICFPCFELQQRYIDPDTRHQVSGSKWNPKITGLRYLNAKTVRLEKMDGGRINHVYISNQWLDNPGATGEDLDVDQIPALSEQSPTADMERLIRDARSRNAAPASRPTHIAMPVTYNEYGHPYYPIPAHYSVFSGDVYLYAMTMISDRKRRRDNANVIGRIIFISDEYLQRLYVQRECTTADKKRELFNSVIGEINTFLKNRDNMGEPLVAYTFIGADGKPYKSWEIVEIENASKSAAEANKEELAEISSIILFAWGVDSPLIGNTPGTTTRSGGTDLRERYLLKQIQMSLLQQLVLKPLDVIKHRNGWCDPLCWEIRREVMTTLDNSKTGVTTAETE